MDKHAVKGKIILCMAVQGPEHIGFFSGAAGVIFGDVSSKDLLGTYALPATTLSGGNILQTLSYIELTRYRSIIFFQ